MDGKLSHPENAYSSILVSVSGKLSVCFSYLGAKTPEPLRFRGIYSLLDGVVFLGYAVPGF